MILMAVSPPLLVYAVELLIELDLPKVNVTTPFGTWKLCFYQGVLIPVIHGIVAFPLASHVSWFTQTKVLDEPPVSILESFTTFSLTFVRIKANLF